MSDVIGIVGLLTAVGLLMFLVYKGLNVVVMTILCSLLIAVTNGMNPITTFTGVYMERFGYMIGFLGAVFILGAVIGAIYDNSGAAYSLVKFFTDHVKAKSGYAKTVVSVLCVMLFIITLGYFGVDTLVLIFLTVPICTQFCRQNNWSAKFVPVLVAAGPLANILPGAAQTYNIIPTKYLGTHPMASAIPGFIACAVGFVLILLYTTRSIEKSVAQGETFQENNALKKTNIAHEKYPHPLLAFIPLLSIFVCFNLFKQTIELSLFAGAVFSVALFWKYLANIPETLNVGISNAARTALNFGALMGFSRVAMSAPVFSNFITAVAGNDSVNPILVIVASVALLTGIGSSANAGITATMEAFAGTFLANGVSPAIIHRAATLTGATLDTLPTNSGVIISLNLSGSTHKLSYKYIFVNTVLIPFVIVAVYVVLVMLFPGIAV